MAEFASPQETQRALEILLDLQSEDSNRLDGILNKYANPFTSWPLLAEPTRKFLSFFETPGSPPEAEPAAGRSINPRLKEMIDVFDKEIGEAQAGKVKASAAAARYVNALIKKAKEVQMSAPEAQTPPPQELEGAPVSPERVGAAVSAAILRPGPPEEKEMFFHALVSFASEQPAKTVEGLLPRAEAVVQVSRVLTTPEGAFSGRPSFSMLATNGPQRVAAGFFDVMIRDTATKEAIINKVLLDRVDAVVNRPGRLPAPIVQEFIDRWGEGFVNSVWFEKLRADAGHMMAEQRGAFKMRGGFINFASDLATTIFRAPPDENFLADMEAHRFLGAQGVPVGDVFFARNALLGFDGRMIRAGMKYPLFGLLGGVGKPGATVSGGAGVLFGGVVGGLLSSNQRSFSAVLNRGVSSLLGFFGRLKSAKTKINGWLIAGAVVFLFVLFILPIFGQSMIDTAIVTGGAGETGAFSGANGYTTAVGPIGATTRSCANINGILVNQCSSPWGGAPFKNIPGCTVCRGGCGPTATTMILHAFGSSSTVPNVSGRVAAQDVNKYHNYACSSWIQSNLAIMQEEDLRTIGIGLNWRDADKYLKACGLIFALGNTSTSGHFVVITGINWDTSGKNVVSYATLDPYYSYTTQTSSTFRVTAMYAVVHQ